MTKINKLTPGRNMLWESSRMMLPEHKETLIRHRKELPLASRPVLDEQETERIASRIGESLRSGRMLTLKLYDAVEERTVSGVVAGIDERKRTVRLQSAAGLCVFSFEDIIGAEEAEEAEEAGNEAD